MNNERYFLVKSHRALLVKSETWSWCKESARTSPTSKVIRMVKGKIGLVWLDQVVESKIHVMIIKASYWKKRKKKKEKKNSSFCPSDRGILVNTCFFASLCHSLWVSPFKTRKKRFQNLLPAFQLHKVNLASTLSCYCQHALRIHAKAPPKDSCQPTWRKKDNLWFSLIDKLLKSRKLFKISKKVI